MKKPRRSALYTPGTNSRALEKTRQVDADVFILDLEDAVAPEAKLDARANVRRFLQQRESDGREVLVRVNGLATPWCGDDIAALAGTGVDGILLPKVDTAADLQRAVALTAAAATPLWCMIETPLAILNLQPIAQAGAGRVAGWVMGSNDLVKEMRAAHTPDRLPLLYALSAAVVAARAYGLAILDGVHNDIADSAGLAAACAQARTLGFDGKTLIHPGQVAACNQAFSPDPRTLLDAHKIVAAFALPENAGRGVLQIDGRMVERLHEQIARDTLALAAAIAARGGAKS